MTVACDVTIAARTADGLGEGPVYDAADGSLRWVDIGRSLWRRQDLVTGEVTTVSVEPAMTGFAPTAGQDDIGAFTTGFATLDRKGHRLQWLCQPEREMPDHRFDEVGTDPRGRFLAGSMNTTGSATTGSRCSLSDTGLRCLRTGFGICNTVAFGPDGATLHTADSATGQMFAFGYDAETGLCHCPSAYRRPAASQELRCLLNRPHGTIAKPTATATLWEDHCCRSRLT